ncbi:MAG: hypothetical protein AAF483_16425 [Planctomycetota bacterium]
MFDPGRHEIHCGIYSAFCQNSETGSSWGADMDNPIDTEFLAASLARVLGMKPDSMQWSGLCVRGAGPSSNSMNIYGLLNAPKTNPEYWQDFLTREFQGRGLQNEQIEFKTLDKGTEAAGTNRESNETLARLQRALQRLLEFEDLKRNVYPCDAIQVHWRENHYCVIFLLSSDSAKS